MPHAKRSCYDRTRLYFLVYVCDHQVSLSRGRPPMTGDCRTLKAPRTLLDSMFSSQSDLQLVSQVELWSIGTQVFETFGAATDSAFVSTQLHHLESFNHAYEHWHQDWTSLLKSQLAVEPVLQAMLDLIFHSARLFLYSHVFRGPEPESVRLEDMSGPLNTISVSATQSALSIISKITELNEAQIGSKLSFYFSTTSAFASVFLLKGPCHDLCQRDRAAPYLQALARLVTSASSVKSPAHPISNITRSMKTALDTWPVTEENGNRDIAEPAASSRPYNNHAVYGLSNSEVQVGEIYDFALDLPSLEDFDFRGTNWNLEY